MIIENIIERPDACTEVGMTYGEEQPQDRVYVHMEDDEGAVTVFLTPAEAYALMAALGQAVRAVEAD